MAQKMHMAPETTEPHVCPGGGQPRRFEGCGVRYFADHRTTNRAEFPGRWQAGDGLDEDKVREHAEAHGRAIVAGDLARAAGDLDEGVKAKAPSIMKRLPRPVTASEITSIVAGADAFVVHTRYEGDEGATTVESRWAEVGGRPLIVALDMATGP
jgi:hypothetical protein